MTDNELIELSAKSIGIELVYQGGAAGYYRDFGDCVAWLAWDPIVDGADAMRLVAVLGLQLKGDVVTCATGLHSCQVERGADADLATMNVCRAIAGVAADIGRVMDVDNLRVAG
ncbi:hypothetical protein [Pseudomonas sp. PSKL.D1]|uniref:hypothetical protein n=1 Tax=Pseudomonas sp. PSKL.D1 TaxID=3029060 RepID=UPI0023818BF0|nr:hypothetical protein [Pseudomonas sp. PSKL.D1]WDY57345.1 hypothetical protein PVV54_22635 [Pseudomonas sp. PSKL.D1]